MPTNSGVYLVSAQFHPEKNGPAYSKEDEAGSYENSTVRSSEDINMKFNEGDESAGTPFRGMGKEELLKHSSKPLWRRMRMLCMSIVLLGWLALIITVVALVLIYPRCRAPESRDWWQQEVIYRLYVPSFKDSDGDGYGDLKGVESKLDYIKDLGFNIISLSPFYSTDASVDSDFSIIDHTAVDGPRYGTLNDFKSLVNAAHGKDMHVIVDFIPNHTSDKHQWFVESGKSDNRSNLHRNYYVWTDAPTSNWRSIYDNSSWTPTSLARGQFYLHQFLSSQPDLNLRSSQVQDELEKILRFWLELGVDGFNVQNSAFLFEDYDMRNEEKSASSQSNNMMEYDYYDHQYTYGLPEVHDMLARWRFLLMEFGKMNGTEKFMMADIKGNISTTVGYYGMFGRDGVNIAANLHFMDKKDTCNGACIATFVNSWMDNLPRGRWASWMSGNENSARFASRFNVTYMKAFNMLIMLLPGTPVVYYGDEIGLKDLTLSASPRPWYQQQVMRGLMQWENGTTSGFQSNCSISACSAPWTETNSDYEANNVMNQMTTAGSLLNLMKNLTSLRSRNSFVIGEYYPALRNDNIFSFVREFDGENGYLVAINFGDTTVTHDYTGSHGTIQNPATVELTTGSDVAYGVGDEISTNEISLGPHQGIVLSWAFAAKEL